MEKFLIKNMGTTFKQPKKTFDVIIFDVFKKSVMPILKQNTETLAEEIRQELIDRLEDQSFHHKALNADYRKYKKKHDIDNGILLATREYIDAIQVEKTPYGFIVGVSDTMHEPLPGKGTQQLEMKLLAKILEFGSITQNIPARPHWRPVLSKFVREKGRIRRLWSKQMQKAINSAYVEYNREQEEKDSSKE